MAKRFGQSAKFAVGAALFWPAFGGILAFSKAEIQSQDQGPIIQPPDASLPPSQQPNPSASTQSIIPSPEQSSPFTTDQQAPLPSEQSTADSPTQPNQPPDTLAV